VRGELGKCFGSRVFAPNGAVDREWLRKLIFDSKEKRHKLEQILHPAIRREWMAAVGQVKLQKHWLVVDIPLLYETQAERYFDSVAVVAAPESAQLERMSRDRGLGDDVAGQIMASQMELSRKIEKADHVIWNNSTKEHLGEQARLLAGLLKKRHG
jgi:dephospho-CoA kinase